MATPADATRPHRAPLNTQAVLRAAVALADESGVDALSMRKLAQALGVAPMALYKHVDGKDELLDGMIEVVIGEIDPPEPGVEWKTAIRRRVLSARQMLLRHPWASQVIEARTKVRPTPAVLAYMDTMIEIFRSGGLSVDLTHHALHTMGSRLLGFSQELFNESGGDDQEPDPETSRAMAEQYPNITALVTAITHDEGSVVGAGCDDQFEFEFALDLLLNGLERLHDAAS
ncbi:TetR/AcrR family transcriptional regulator [Actinomadura rudentiformis]|uniref:TetR/AcrR family transcriptional regulator n=1 Tax=Actinomadura rudentiformis TaxID=359158 RepID=A0A6H9YGR8_9ACTN|nr:TetR/AcrR family transcriptional regulator [Actinomadura rudentiformis]KAB2339663.1 TetR/AcrR family transcriptional regulator [Actinomadura rudentiformis]